MKCTKIILWCCIVFIISCSEPELPTPPPTSVVESIFTQKENRVINGQNINFDLPSDGVYTLSLIDKDSEQVISRERFTGKSGKIVKRIYTKSIESRYLYLLLEDVTKTEIGKTIVITK